MSSGMAKNPTGRAPKSFGTRRRETFPQSYLSGGCGQKREHAQRMETSEGEQGGSRHRWDID